MRSVSRRASSTFSRRSISLRDTFEDTQRCLAFLTSLLVADTDFGQAAKWAKQGHAGL
jgi:hypothetical protein